MSTAENINSLIEELTEAIENYLDGYFPEDYRRPMENDDDALFRQVYEPLMDMESLIRFVDSEKTIHTLKTD